MKRIRNSVPMFLSAALAVSCIARADDDKAAPVAGDAPKEAAVAIHGTPKVDGEIDEIWQKVPELEVKKIVPSDSTISEDKMATAKVKLLWDADHLYALFVVKDSALSASGTEPHEQDSIELFIDELNEKAGSYQKDDVQYRVSFDGKKSGGEGYEEDNLKSAVKKTDDGYIVELSAKLAHAKREAGTKIGVDLQVNDNDGKGSRVAIAKWHHPENDSYQSTTNFGTVVLKD